MTEHGGNLHHAKQVYGGSDWIDLSTGINRVPYPVPRLSAAAFTDLPGRDAMDLLLQTAGSAYRTRAPLLALAGAQAAIQLVPHLRPKGLARIVSPTYNEHAATLRACGWQVEEVPSLDALAGADIGIVVNPNNPDGAIWRQAALLGMIGKVGLLVVDESFADPLPQESLVGEAGREGLLILRSFGKFYGLAGLRLGFALGWRADIDRMAALSGPWPVSGPAIEVACLALADQDWADRTTTRLMDDSARLDTICVKFGWQRVGGTPLFRLYNTPDAKAGQDFLARRQIWSRIFPYSPTWIRLGLPGAAIEWDRVSAAADGHIAHPT